MNKGVYITEGLMYLLGRVLIRSEKNPVFSLGSSVVPEFIIDDMM